LTYIDAKPKDRCPTCHKARFWGACGVCRRPDMGKYRLKSLNDPFLPRVTRDDWCGQHESIAAIKAAAQSAAQLTAWLERKVAEAE